MRRFPPETESLDELANFFDQADTTQLADIEEVETLPESEEVPERELVPVSLRLIKEDVDQLKKLAQDEGMPYTTMIRWVLHRFARSTRKSQ